MILRYFYDERLAQASYMLGCAVSREALVVDAARDIAPYLAEAEKHGLSITHITETHIHADFVSGSRELAAATGARVYLSREGGDDWQYGWANDPHVTLVGEGDMWMVGNVRVDVLHTPGHTPEHISFLITDTAATRPRGIEAPIGLFSGDFLFAGDVGRPDLLERAAGVTGSKEVGASAQFRSVQLAKHLPDFVQVWPGHGAGSACGKALGAVPSTTIGYERLFNPAFQFEDEQEFVAWLLADQPDAPRYFARMKSVNREGPALLSALPPAPKTTARELAGQAPFEVQVFDLRTRAEYLAGHLAGAISIPTTDNAWLTWLGWFVDYDHPAWFVVNAEQGRDERTAQLLSALHGIGVDEIGGFAVVEEQQKGPSLDVLSRAEIEALIGEGRAELIDVRNPTEVAEAPDPVARNVPLSRLSTVLRDLPREKRIFVRCAAGFRAVIAASLLQRAGFAGVGVLDQ